MWKCPVCDQENNVATVCPTCGYDRTCDYERYPTAFTVTTAKPTRTLRQEWQAKQGPALPELVAEWFDAPQDDASAAERCFRSIYPDTMGGDALWQEQLEWTRSAENVNADMMMYPDENGKLMLLSPIGSLAGASYYEHSYPFAA